MPKKFRKQTTAFQEIFTGPFAKYRRDALRNMPLFTQDIPSGPIRDFLARQPLRSFLRDLIGGR